MILVSFLSGEVTSYTDTSYCIQILWEVYAVPFFMGHPVLSIKTVVYYSNSSFETLELWNGTSTTDNVNKNLMLSIVVGIKLIIDVGPICPLMFLLLSKIE